MTWLGDCGHLDGKRRERKHQWARRWTQTFAVSSIFGEAKDPRADSEYPKVDPGELMPCVSGKPNQQRDVKVHRRRRGEEDLQHASRRSEWFWKT